MHGFAISDFYVNYWVIFKFFQLLYIFCRMAALLACLLQLSTELVCLFGLGLVVGRWVGVFFEKYTNQNNIFFVYKIP